MKTIILAFLLISVVFSFSFRGMQKSPYHHDKCHRPNHSIKEHVKNPIEKRPVNELPEELLWNNVKGTDFLTLPRN